MTLPDPEVMFRQSRADEIRKAIAYLKTTPAVTLSGQGGAYELLEAYAQKIENGETK